MLDLPFPLLLVRILTPDSPFGFQCKMGNADPRTLLSSNVALVVRSQKWFAGGRKPPLTYCHLRMSVGAVAL